jgi:hypothetical protein
MGGVCGMFLCSREGEVFSRSEEEEKKINRSGTGGICRTCRNVKDISVLDAQHVGGMPRSDAAENSKEICT